MDRLAVGRRESIGEYRFGLLLAGQFRVRADDLTRHDLTLTPQPVKGQFRANCPNDQTDVEK
jgi:hypothetical protein